MLTFNLVAGSRTAPLIRKAKDGKALEAEQQTLRTPSGAALRIPLPAAAAPTRVAPLTILPAFRLEHEGQTVTPSPATPGSASAPAAPGSAPVPGSVSATSYGRLTSPNV